MQFSEKVREQYPFVVGVCGDKWLLSRVPGHSDKNWQKVCEAYPTLSERVLLNMYVVAENVEAIRAVAAGRGEQATFWTHTYATVVDYDTDVKHWRTFMGRLRRKVPGTCGVRVFERGGRNGRFHVHTVLDRFVPVALMEECCRGTNLGFVWADPVDENGGSYLYKELSKQFGRRGEGHRLWATFGKFPGRCVLGDFTVESPLKECRRAAWGMRETGEPQYVTWERARWLYAHTDVGQDIQHGEAYEDMGGGDADFDPGQLGS